MYTESYTIYTLIDLENNGYVLVTSVFHISFESYGTRHVFRGICNSVLKMYVLEKTFKNLKNKAVKVHG